MPIPRRAVPTAILAICFSLLGVPTLLGQQTAGGAPPQSPASQLASEGTAALSGVVTDATTKQPIAGVMVYLGFQGRGAVGRLSRQISDERGRFVFTDLPAGNNFFINAYKLGYLEGHYGVGAGGLLGGLLALTDGQWLKDVSVTMIRLGSISGTITDEHGDPAVGVIVRVLAKIPVAGRMRLAASVTAKTDDRGIYRLPNLRPGSYLVHLPSVQQSYSATLTAAELAGITPEQVAAGRAVADLPAAMDVGGARLVVGGYPAPPTPVNGRPRVYPPLFHPGVTAIGSAASIEIRVGEDRSGVNVQLQAVPATSISGVVEGPADALAGSIVRLLPEGLEELGNGSEAATATIGSDGKFAFLNIAAGSYTIDVRRSVSELSYRMTLGTPSTPLPYPPGLASTSGGGILSGPSGTSHSTRTTRGGGGAHFAQQKVTVDARPIANLVVTLRRGATIRGKFVMEDGTAPEPGPGSGLVYAEPADGNLGLGMPPATQPAASPATFEIPGIGPGQFLLRFVSVPGNGVPMSVVGEDGVDYRVKPFDTSSGRDLNVTVTVTTKRIDLSGSAADAKGGQVTNAVVIAFPVEREQWSNYGLSPSRLRASPTTSSGTYRFQSLPAGDYFLVAVPPDQAEVWQEPSNLAKLAPLATRISLAWGDKKMHNVTVVRLK